MKKGDYAMENIEFSEWEEFREPEMTHGWNLNMRLLKHCKSEPYLNAQKKKKKIQASVTLLFLRCEVQIRSSL